MVTFPKIGRQFIDYFPRNLDMFPVFVDTFPRKMVSFLILLTGKVAKVAKVAQKCGRWSMINS